MLLVDLLFPLQEVRIILSHLPLEHLQFALWFRVLGFLSRFPIVQHQPGKFLIALQVLFVSALEVFSQSGCYRLLTPAAPPFFFSITQFSQEKKQKNNLLA